jgi:hypothetical protein
MMENGHKKLLLSASLVCLLGGCATGQRASLDIRTVDHPQIGSTNTKAIEQGKDALVLGQYADAISAFRAALRQETDSAEANNGLAIAYDRIGRKDLARRYFELAVAEKPEDARYRGNLARFFQNEGEPELAAGLLDVPAALATNDAPVAVVTPAEVTVIAAADAPPVDGVVAVQGGDTLAAMIADLSVQSHAEAAATFVPSSVALASVQDEIAPAVFRPSAASVIKPALLSLPTLPAPDPLPFKDRTEPVADLPRGDRRQTETHGPYIERMSLGVVKLVTLPLALPKDVAFNLDHLGEELTLLAAAEARDAQFQTGTGLRGRLAIQTAVERAAMDEALSKATALAAAVEQIGKEFVYIRFDDDGDTAGNLAA